MTGRDAVARAFGSAMTALVVWVVLLPGRAQAATWEVHGPEGGYLESLVMDPTNPRVLYAGTQNGGLFKSVDRGESWVPINNGLTNLFVQVIVIDPAAPMTLYAGTYGGGVFKSLTAG